MSKKRIRGMTEIKVKLLPEKAKRDYVLRMVSSIIVLTFIIINILFVYIPLTNYTSQLNKIKSENASKELQYKFLNDKYQFFYHDIYTNNNNTIDDILSSTLDINKLLLIFDKNARYVDVHQNLPFNELIKHENNIKLLPTNSDVQSINFSEGGNSFAVTVQFDGFDELTTYQLNLERIKYVKSVDVGNYNFVPVEGSAPRVKTSFKIIIDTTSEYCPKVGVGNE